MTICAADIDWRRLEPGNVHGDSGVQRNLESGDHRFTVLRGAYGVW